MAKGSRVGEFQWFKESTNSRVKLIELSTIKIKLASTAEPELGTAQPQLVKSFKNWNTFIESNIVLV